MVSSVAEPFECGDPGRLCIPGYSQSSTHGNNASWFPAQTQKPSQNVQKQLAERRMELSPANPPGRPARGARGAPENPAAVKIRSRKKKGAFAFFVAPWVALRARWGWNRSERVAFCGTRADIASTIAGFRPLCSQQATLLATFQKGNTGGVRGGVLGGQIPGAPHTYL